MCGGLAGTVVSLQGSDGPPDTAKSEGDRLILITALYVLFVWSEYYLHVMFIWSECCLSGLSTMCVACLVCNMSDLCGMSLSWLSSFLNIASVLCTCHLHVHLNGGFSNVLCMAYFRTTCFHFRRTFSISGQPFPF